MADALFEIRGAVGLEVPATVLGVWNSAPGRGLPFGGDNEIDAETPVWTVSLAPQTAKDNLQAAEEQLRSTRAALREANARLNEFIESAARGKSFGGENGETRAPELELQALIIQMGRGARADFGALDFLTLDWQSLARQFQEFLAELQRLLADPLLVETRNKDSNEIVARTAVGWTGHSHTAVTDDKNESLRAEHEKALALALGQRTVLFQIAALAAEGAVRLTIVIAMPAAAVSMMPGIYKYIARVMDEYFKIRERLRE